MKYKRLLIITCLIGILCASCKKDHYNVSNVNGVNMEGEMLLPLASASVTLMDMMQKFNIDSIISCSEDGNLSFNYTYTHNGAVKGSELLRFKDLNYSEHFSIENPFQVVLPQAFDTMFQFEHTIMFEAEHISVMEAMMRSGHFDFALESNLGLLQRVVIRSSDIKDAEGHDLQLDFPINSGTVGFDLDGMFYETDTANSLHLSYDFYIRVEGFTDPELYFDVNIQGRDLAIQEMSGYVEPYGSRNRLDTTFVMFPEDVSGSLEIRGAHLRLYERNTFGLAAQLDIDTALVFGDDFASFSLFDPLPLSVNIPMQEDFGQVLDKTISGTIPARGGNVMTSSNFIVNPTGMTEMVSVSDTCNIDVLVETEIPFSFAVEYLHYYDTAQLEVSEVGFPEQIESLTLDLTVNSTMPLNLVVDFFAYDSKNEVITDVLASNVELIKASFDGQPSVTEVTLEITGERITNFFHSDQLIMRYAIDTDAREVHLNAQQGLDLYMKAKVKYNGVVEFKN